MNVFSAFDGISCGQLALRKAGVHYDSYTSSEIDRYALHITNKNFPDTLQYGDVRGIALSKVVTPDLLIGGSPCPSFSVGGLRGGFDDPRGRLFFQFVRLLNELHPAFFFYENVVMSKANESVITSELGVQPVAVNSAMVSAQHRRRLYWTNIPFCGSFDDRGVTIDDVIDKSTEWDRYSIDMETLNINYSAYLADGRRYGVIVGRRTEEAKAVRRENVKNGKDWNPFRMREYVTRTDGKANCLTTKPREESLLADKNRGVRYWTPLEWERLMGIQDGYTDGVFDSRKYALIGNGWQVDTVAEFFRGLK